MNPTLASLEQAVGTAGGERPKNVATVNENNSEIDATSAGDLASIPKA
jgi:hypothetical protein